MNINLTLIGQMIAFVCFVVFCMKYVWPPILAAMAEREEKIADGLAAADRASHDLELAQEKAVERLKEAKTEAAGIIDAANKRGSQMVEEAKGAAVVEADRVKALPRQRLSRKPTARVNNCVARLLHCLWLVLKKFWALRSTRKLTASWSRSWPQNCRAR